MPCRWNILRWDMCPRSPQWLLPPTLSIAVMAQSHSHPIDGFLRQAQGKMLSSSEFLHRRQLWALGQYWEKSNGHIFPLAKAASCSQWPLERSLFWWCWLSPKSADNCSLLWWLQLCPCSHWKSQWAYLGGRMRRKGVKVTLPVATILMQMKDLWLFSFLSHIH